MSLYPVYVLADDMQFYRDPTIRGRTAHSFEWFLYFDEEYGETIVMERDKGLSWGDMEIHCWNALNDAGLWFNNKLRRGHRSRRCFGLNNKVKETNSFYVDLSEPPPAELFAPQRPTTIKAKLCMQGVKFTFGVDLASLKG